MKSLSLISLLCCAGFAAGADSEWVTVGDPGNPPDHTGHGAVASTFQIARFETTVAQYEEFLNAVAATDRHGLWNRGTGIERRGAAGAYHYTAEAGREQHPLVSVLFLDALRFANWHHHGRGSATTESGAYDLSQGDLATRQPGARYAVASEDEWYKAAYHQPPEQGGPLSGYWLFPTRSDEAPTFRKAGATEANSACFEPSNRGGFRFMPVGSYVNSASFYGTYDQGGNVWEWTEGIRFSRQRSLRGGSGAHTVTKLRSVTQMGSSPTLRFPDTGFRLTRRVPTAPDNQVSTRISP
ncbi:MAG: SUMF1/EgtB/PvdO family nonheme iron enzyme [Planctomycetes bacterium]|nr:SUMF1/EgtB/PvdO family nonheme iron enzyme [Planctomycetota bacterium]